MSASSTNGSAPPGVGLVQKTLQILDLFQSGAPSWSQGEIAAATGIPKSTVNRLVKFITDRGYLTALNGRNRYVLGPASIDLGRRASTLFDFRGICRPVLEKLSQETGETVILTTIVGAGNAVRCVDQIESTREGLRVFEQIGSIFPLHAGAAPKAILANLSEDEQDRYLGRQMESITKRTLTNTDLLRQDIKQTQARGYAVSSGETYEGVVGLAAAFFWDAARPAGSVAIAIPEQRSDAEAIASLGTLLKEAGAEITAMLSASGQNSNIETLAS